MIGMCDSFSYPKLSWNWLAKSCQFCNYSDSKFSIYTDYFKQCKCSNIWDVCYFGLNLLSLSEKDLSDMID